MTRLAQDLFSQLTPAEAKAILLDSDPALTDEARAVLATLQAPDVPALAAPADDTIPVRYPSDLFATSEYTYYMAVRFPLRVRRIEFFIAHFFLWSTARRRLSGST